MTYADFIAKKSQIGGMAGFSPLWVPDWLYGFQQYGTGWAIRKGRSALVEDCGLGKTPQQLVWAQNVVQHTNGRVLIMTPLAVSQQTKREADKFGIDCYLSRDGSIGNGIAVTNYEKLHLFDETKFVGVVLDESSILKSFTARGGNKSPGS